VGQGADKVGRNAPCPCGSGRKHKHCCLGTEDGEARPPTRPSRLERIKELGAEIVAEMTRIHSMRDEKGLQRRIARFAELTVAGGPLTSLRFDDDLFERIVGGRVEEAVAEHGTEAPRRLLDWCLGELATDEQVDAIFDGIGTVLRRQELSSEDRMALAAGAATLAVGADEPGFDATAVPALNVVFQVQLAERVSRIRSFDDQLAVELKRRGEAAFGAEAPDQALGEAFTGLLRTMEEDPFLRASTAAQADEARERLSRALQDETLPPIVTGDEAIYLTVRSRDLLTAAYGSAAGGRDDSDEDAEETFVALSAEVQRALDEGLAESIRARLSAAMADTSLDKNVRRLASDLMIHLDGRVVVISLFGLAAIATRDEAEANHAADVLDADAITAESLAPYIAYLEDSEEDPRWLRAARELLESSPMPMPAAGDEPPPE